MKSIRTQRGTPALSWSTGLLFAVLAALTAAFAWIGVIEPILSFGRDHKAAVAEFHETYGALAPGVNKFEVAYDVTLVNADLDASPKTITVRTAEGTTQTCTLPSVEDYEQRVPLADCIPA